MRERNPCAYILASGRHGTIYIGVTSDLMARLHQHREGLIEGYTKRYGVKRLVYGKPFWGRSGYPARVFTADMAPNGC